jgi:hypothetical protein
MKIKIFGSPTLEHFTSAISNEFRKSKTVVDNESFDVALIQIHGSVNSINYDLNILKDTSSIKNKIFLIHRPDELLEYRELKEFFENNKNYQILFLGDLVFNFPFWHERKKNSFVIPHPFLDLNKPEKNPKKS